MAILRWLDDFCVRYGHIAKPFQPPEIIERIKRHRVVRYLQTQFRDDDTRLKRQVKDREPTEDRIGQSDEQYRRLFEGLIDIYYRTDSMGRITMISPSVSAAGYKLEEIIGTNARDFYANPEDKGKFLEIITKEGIVKDFEVRLKRKDGSVHWVSVNARLIKDEAGNVLGVEGLHRNIDDRKQAEDALKNRNREYDELVASIPVGIYKLRAKKNGNLIFDYTSPRWCEINGLNREDILREAQLALDLVHPEERQYFRDLFRVARKKEERFQWEGRFVIDCQTKFMRIESWPTRLQCGDVVWTGIQSDITERKRAADELEKRFLALSQPLNTTEDLTFESLFNLSDIQRIQDLFAQALGVAALITRPDGTPITQPSNFTSLCSELIRKTEKGAKNCGDSDATIGQYNPSGPNIRSCLSAGLCNAGAGITVGGRHVANWLIGQVRSEALDEEKIIEYAREIGADEAAFRDAYLKVPFVSQEQFEIAAQVLFVVANQISTSAYQNLQQARFIAEQKRAEKSLRKNEAQFRRLVESIGVGILILQDGRIIYQNPEQERILNGSLSAPYELRNLIEMVQCDDRSAFEKLCEQRSPRDSVPLKTVMRLVSPAGQEAGVARWISCSSSTIEYRKEGAQLIHMMDITQLKNLERQVMLREKMVSLGHVAAGIAHEIRNPLSGINVYLDSIRDCYQDPECSDDVLGLIKEAQATSRKIESVIRRVLDFSRPSDLKMRPTSINNTIQEALKLAAVNLRKGSILVDLDLDPNLPQVYADAQLIEQVMLNLVTNATDVLKAVKRKRHIRISTRRENGHVLTEVEDSGPGIPPEMREQVFEPFFTTRRQGVGIGLGICKRIVVDHCGDIYISTSPLGGAQFNILVPVEKRNDSR